MVFLDARVVKTSSENFVVFADNREMFVKMSGKLRVMGRTPVINDRVDVYCEGATCVINKIHEAKNYFERPKCANISKGIIVSSLIEPCVHISKLYTMILKLELKSVIPIICFTKKDLVKKSLANEKILNALTIDKIPYIVINNNNFQEADFFEQEIKNESVVLMGESGVGKSSLFNNLLGYEKSAIGTVNKKLKRGNHTTTNHSLIKIMGGYLIDTPGFLRINLDDETANEVSKGYFDFAKYSTKCKYRNCLHIKENGCFVKEKLLQNKISTTRYNIYEKIIREIK